MAVQFEKPIALGADHGGYELKEAIKQHLEERGIAYRDFGTNSTASCDYPDYAAATCGAVTNGSSDFAILCCGTGVGMSMCANKIKGIRACCCSEPFSAEYTRRHDPNLLVTAWFNLMGRSTRKRKPTQEKFEPLVTAPMVSVTSRVVYILRHLIAGTAAKMSQLFSRQQTRSTNVATFLALLELVRGGRVKLDDEGRLTMQRGRIQRDKEKE